MISDLSTLALWSYAASALLHGAFAVYLFAAWRGRLSGALLCLAVALGGVSATTNWGFLMSGQTWLLQLAAVLDVLWFGGWAAFVGVLLRTVLGRSARAMLMAGVVAVLLQLLAVTAEGFELRQLGDPARLTIFAALVAAVTLLVMTEQLFRALPVTERWAVKPACLGLAATAMFDLYYFADGFLFGRLDADVWAVRGLAHGAVLPLFALSAARTPAWNLRLAVSRELVFHSSALAVSGLYLLLVSAAGYYVRYFGGEWGRALQTAFLFAGLVLLGFVLLSGSQRARLRVFLNKHLFPYRYDYRAEWLRFTRALSGAEGTLGLGDSVIKALGDLVESPGGGLWLRGGRGEYAQLARLNMPPCDAREPAESAFVQVLAEREWVFNLEEWRSGTGVGLELSPPTWLSHVADAWLLVPLVSNDGLIGFVVLLAPRTPVEVNWEVLDLLKTAQRQAASYLTRMMATEALLEARKFDAFNRMTAFVVHDLKNLVAQLSLLLKNAERHRHNPAFQDDMLETIAHVESKMRGLMKQLQEKTSINPCHRVDLAAVLERIVERRRALGQAVDLLCLDRPQVMAHGEKLDRVIGHLVQNALDASGPRGKVQLRLGKADGGQCRLEVNDDGCGMSPEFVRSQLFKPFQTTKADGMGIGMFETQQYLHELGGRILVDSEPGRGTRITVFLPVGEKSNTPRQDQDKVFEL
jgi:putative PEP-CTERM system histidine kinase